MPNVGVAVVNFFAGAGAATAGAGAIVANVINVGLLTTASKALTPKVRFGQTARAKSELAGRTLNTRSAIAPRQYIYGQVRVGGQILFIDATGPKNEFLHIVLVHCSHEVEELGDLYVNDELVPLTGNAPSAGNKYADHLRVYGHTGSAAQTHDTVLSAASAKWTSAHDLRGMAYTYFRLQLAAEDNVFPGGIPTFSRVVKGRKVYDPRTATTAYSSNAALCIGDYLTSEFGYGRYGLANADIASAEWQAAANVCAEAVTLDANAWVTAQAVTAGTRRTSDTAPVKLYVATTDGTTGATAPTGTGTGISDGGVTWDYVETFANTEERYTLNGIVLADEDPIAVVKKMKTAMAGFVEYIGDKWYIHAGAWRAPTVTLSEADFASGISGATKDDRRNAANRVKGVFSDASDKFNVVEFPAVTNATYLSEDAGIEAWRDIDLPFTTSAAAAQRIAKIQLEKGRQQITHTALFKLKAMRIQAGDVFSLTFAKYGYSSKAFLCISHQLKTVDGGALAVEMTFRETASSVYSWANGEETVLDPAPNSNLPDPFTVPAPATSTLDSGTGSLIAKGGTVLSRIKVVWAVAAEAHVLAHEIQWQQNGAGTWENSVTVPMPSAAFYISDVEDGQAYDVRVRAVTAVRKGLWYTHINHTVVGKTAAPATPTGLAVTGLIQSAILSVDRHPDADFRRFLVWQETAATPVPVPGTDAPDYETPGTELPIRALAPGTTYYFFIAAEDTSGNFSAVASLVSLTPSKLHTEILASAGGRLVAQSEAASSWPPATSGIRSEFDKDHFYIENLVNTSGDEDTAEMTHLKLELKTIRAAANDIVATLTPTSLQLGSLTLNIAKVSTLGFEFSPGGISEFKIEDDGSLGVKLNWQSDTNLYRSAANTLKTDDALDVGGRVTMGEYAVLKPYASGIGNLPLVAGALVYDSAANDLAWCNGSGWFGVGHATTYPTS